MCKLMLLIFILAATACGQEPPGKDGSVSVAFQPYLVAFRADAVAHNRPMPKAFMEHLTITFGDASATCQSKNSIGCCSLRTDDVATIVIDQNYWETHGEPFKQSLLYHELGHCFLNRQHRDTLGDGGHPVSIMHSWMIEGQYFQEHMDYYLDELFYE